MNLITGKHLQRRTFLRGIGTVIALPLLDAMAPAMAATANRATPPRRMAFAYVPNGVIAKDWRPEADGPLGELPRTLQPLRAFRDEILVMSGLTQNGGRPLGDGAGDHARAAASYLTGMHPRKTAGADIQVGISVDQVAAQKIGQKTRFASLELGLEDGRMAGNCDSGYSCAYSNSISWRTATTPNPPEVNPRSVFERMFAGYDLSESADERERRERYGKSILDYVLADTQKLRGDLGSTDRRKLDEYLYAVRDVERRIQEAEKNAKNNPTPPSIEIPDGVPAEFNEHARLMFDLQVVAFQTDLTRISTFMMAREGSNRTYREIGVPEAHHGLSHHRNNEEWIEKLAKINRYHVEQFTYFLERLKATPDGDGTMLDHTMVIYGSGLSDGNRHTHNDLPVLILGGQLAKGGRHVTYKDDTPMSNLFLSMLDHAGVSTESIGDSSGKLDFLTDLKA